ncbi:MAG: gamma-glutamyltransferase family protein [Nitriliruptoraceae bacterium]
MPSITRRFPHGVVVSPHHLASAAGQRVLADGGNAIDAAAAANLVLAVVTPYYCGVGGDLLAIVWDGAARGVASTGRAPAGATVAQVRAAIAAGHGDTSVAHPGTAGMPMFGALPVTVPGAVAGWFHLLERWGTRTFGALSAAARDLALEGFEVEPRVGAAVDRARARFDSDPVWEAHYGRMRTGRRFVQRDLAATLSLLAEDGPAAMTRGRLAEAIVATLQARGSSMSLEDLAAHTVDEPTPLVGGYRDVEVLELPPPTQGVTALTALAVLEALGSLPSDRALATHLQIEAVRAAMADRQEHLADPEAMRTGPGALLAPSRVHTIARGIDHGRVASWPPVRPAAGGTAYLCAADRDGLLVSLIQSNFVGFGSGVVVPGTGIGLHDRGAHFSLDPDDPAAIGPRKRPMHTLIPGLALRDGLPWLVFGTMGGDGQPQIHQQLLVELLDRDRSLAEALDAPRFIVDVADGSVGLESRAAAGLVQGLSDRGHDVVPLDAYDDRAGHAHLIEVTPHGYAAASDPRCDGGAIGY